MLKFLLLLILTSPAFAGSITLPKDRTIYISGAIDGDVIFQANEIYRLANKSKDPIYIVINSPGGSVIAGIQVLTAMKAAKYKGVSFHCMTTLLAASMAFQIYANCDRRYAFENSLQLFHPMAVEGRFTGPDLEYSAAQIKMLEAPLVAYLIKALNLRRDVFFTHYQRETLWTSYTLLKVSPRFLTIVDDVVGLPELFTPMK